MPEIVQIEVVVLKYSLENGPVWYQALAGSITPRQRYTCSDDAINELMHILNAGAETGLLKRDLANPRIRWDLRLRENVREFVENGFPYFGYLRAVEDDALRCVLQIEIP